MDDTPQHRCWLTVDRAALQHNFAQVTARVGNAKVMAVIKANGYGHGMELVADCLANADEYAVAGVSELKRLRTAGLDKPVTLLSAPINLAELEQVISLNARLVVYDWSQLTLLEQLQPKAGLDIWLKIDSGMGRLGFALNDHQAVLSRLRANKALGTISLMTHLGNADDAAYAGTQQQLTRFAEVVEAHKWHQISVLNSAGIINFATQSWDVVRPGIMLYGVSPVLDKNAEQCGLLPAMSLNAQLLSVKTMPAGSTIGYGQDCILAQDTRIAIIACGYGDGYPRHAPNGTPVLVNGVLVPLLGRVSMDMLCVDLGAVTAHAGDTATLWGRANPIDNVAKHAGTIAHELFCNVSERVARIEI